MMRRISESVVASRMLGMFDDVCPCSIRGDECTRCRSSRLSGAKGSIGLPFLHDVQRLLRNPEHLEPVAVSEEVSRRTHIFFQEHQRDNTVNSLDDCITSCTRNCRSLCRPAELVALSAPSS